MQMLHSSAMQDDALTEYQSITEYLRMSTDAVQSATV